jgi:SEC-C motif domain protein
MKPIVLASQLSTCPCDTVLPYGQCCGLYHGGFRHAPTAVALMRSRYSAIALGLVDYLINTTHRSSPHYDSNLKRHRATWQTYCENIQCLGLVIHRIEEGDFEAFVHFSATMQSCNSKNSQQQTENSRFLKLNRRWLYVADASL